MHRGSDHLDLEIAAAFHRGQPLEPGEPVPGCGCPICTGIPEDHPARARKPRRRNESFERLVEAARERPILDVAQDLGLEPRKVGKEHSVRCPFHEDRTPSLFLSSEKGVWTCFSCGRGGDGIGLFQELKKLDFKEAVKEMNREQQGG